MSAHSNFEAKAELGTNATRATARREQILAGATEIFATKGFERATIKEIARAAGVSEGTIYNYFRTKTDLLFGLLDQLNETDERPAAFAQLASGDTRQMFQAQIRKRLEGVGEKLPLLRALLPELLFNEALRTRYLREIVGPTMQMAEGAFGGLMAARALRQADPALTVRLVGGMVFGVLMLEMLGDQELARQRDILPKAIADLLFDGMAPESHESSAGSGEEAR